MHYSIHVFIQSVIFLFNRWIVIWGQLWRQLWTLLRTNRLTLGFSRLWDFTLLVGAN